LAACLGVAACAPTVEAEPKFRSTSVDHYRVRVHGSWDLRVADDAENAEAWSLLEEELSAIDGVLPAPALARVHALTIWLSRADTPCPALCYHVSAAWLTEQGYDPGKAGGVEITSQARFLDWSKLQPWAVLHELAHGYHQQVLGFGEEAIHARFLEVSASGALDSVDYAGGGQRRHYGLTDERELFAEMTETYFGRNDFAPFDRAALHALLPAVESTIGESWGAP
jgi:hypothetical protein